MILHLLRMCKNVNRRVYNDQKNVSVTMCLIQLSSIQCLGDLQGVVFEMVSGIAQFVLPCTVVRKHVTMRASVDWST